MNKTIAFGNKMVYSNNEAILGLNLYFHDSAVALICDGKVVAAIEEERWFRDDKHTAIFPARSIKYCLEAFVNNQNGIAHLAINMEPIRCLSNTSSFMNLFLHPVRWNRKHWNNFRDRTKVCHRTKWQVQQILRELNLSSRFQYHLVDHHDSHAASAFFVSPYDNAAILTIDANGEWSTTTTSIGHKNNIRRLQTLGLPNSLGGLYGSITEHLGFKRNNDEFKVMGLAAYGDTAVYRDAMKKLIYPTDDGFFRIDLTYFDYFDYKISPNKKLTKLLNCPQRQAESKITRQHKAIAAALQEQTENIVIHMAKHLYQQTGLKKLCLAGGVALNCVMNTAILKQTEFEEIFVQPASHDAGSALGAAYWVNHQILGKPRTFVLNRVDFGPEFSDSYIESILQAGLLNYHTSKDICKETANLLAKGKIVGWFQGRAEFGPRALGHRSILADPTDSNMQDHLNRRVKHREDFRPFAPASTIEDYNTIFETEAADLFMTKTCIVRPNYREQLPGITHINGSARLQTVCSDTNPLFHSLIKEFEKLKGLPVLINTSFNVRGEPIVLTPHDALRCFFTTGIDYLVIGNFIVEKGPIKQ